MENMREGTVTIGVDYFANLIEENAVMNEQICALERLLEKEDSKIVYTKHIEAIFGFESQPEPKIWTHVEKESADES